MAEVEQIKIQSSNADQLDAGLVAMLSRPEPNPGAAAHGLATDLGNATREIKGLREDLAGLAAQLSAGVPVESVIEQLRAASVRQRFTSLA